MSESRELPMASQETPPLERAVLTIASGPAIYRRMAINLARSLRLWHSPEDLPVVIASDKALSLPPDLKGVSVLKFDAGLGRGFELKLHLDRLAPARRTLFIDADCLVYGSLDSVFERFQGIPVGVVGTSISSGEWFGDVASYCSFLGVAALPKFNGGLYYLESGPASAQVYTTARGLLPRYDELGLKRLRNLPNDELLIAGAMAVQGIQALPNDGSLMSDPLTFPEHPVRNLLRCREGRLQSPSLIMHFLGDHAQRPAYRAEVLRLALAVRGCPRSLASFCGNACVLWPASVVRFLKNTFRPLFHALLGVRSPTRSQREPV